MMAKILTTPCLKKSNKTQFGNLFYYGWRCNLKCLAFSLNSLLYIKARQRKQSKKMDVAKAAQTFYSITFIKYI
jgi:hypothetical protein